MGHVEDCSAGSATEHYVDYIQKEVSIFAAFVFSFYILIVLYKCT